MTVMPLYLLVDHAMFGEVFIKHCMMKIETQERLFEIMNLKQQAAIL